MDDVRDSIKKIVSNNDFDYIRANEVLSKNKKYVGNNLSGAIGGYGDLGKNKYDFDAKLVNENSLINGKFNKYPGIIEL